MLMFQASPLEEHAPVFVHFMKRLEEEEEEEEDVISLVQIRNSP